MKLHLPTGLRAALIAAFAVAGTLAQAGITMTDITQWAGYDEATGAAHVGNSGGTMYNAKQQQPDYKWNNHWNFVFTVDASTLTEGTYSLDTLALTQNKVEGYIVASSLVMDGSGNGTVTHGGWNQAGATAGVDLSSAKDITFVLSRNNNGGIVSLTGYVDGNFDTAAFTLSVNTNLSFSGESYVSTVSYGSTGGLTAFNHGNNTYRQVADTSVGTFDITKAGYLLGSQVTTADLVKYYTPPSILEWHGTSSATWDLSTANWVAQGETTPTVFVDNASALFGSGSSLVKNIAVTGAVNVDVMTVQADYTFTADSSSSLMVETLNVADGKTATMAGEGYFSVNQLGGAISIAEGAAVNVGGTLTLSATQSLPVSGEGKLVATTLKVTGGEHTITNALEVRGGGDGKGSTNRSLGLAVTGGTVTLEGATHITGALYDAVGTVNIGNGTDAVRVEANRVEFGDTSGSGTSTLNVKKNAILHVVAGDTANAYADTGLVMGEWGGVSVANISGKLYADQATAYVGDNTVTFNIEKDGLMAVKGFSQNQHKADKTETVNLNLLDGGTVVLGANGIASQKPINVSFAAGEVGISDYTVEIAKDVTVSGSGTTFNTSVYEWQGSDDACELVEGSGGGTLTITGNITGDGTILKEGEGTLVLSGGGNVLTHTITANNGNLTLSGGFEIGDIASVGETTYAGGQHTGNGYATASGDVIVYTGTSTVDDSQAVYTYHGAVVTLEGGKYALPGEQDNTTYYINAGTDSYIWIDTNKPGELTGGIVVKEGATLQADKDMSMAEVAASSKGTVQIDEGIVVSSNGGSQHVALTGKGTYALQGGVQTLGSVDASGFNGWVRLTGTINDLNLDGNLQDTNVEFNGVSGYLKNLVEDTDATFSGDIHLANNGETPAIRITNGYSRTKSEYIFTGAVSGEGTWELATPATQHYVFEGSLEDWTGEFKVSSSGGNNGGTSIDFRGAATTVNATITRTGGTLRLFADTDVTFNAVVTGTTSTTVAEGKTVTFASNEDSSIGGISGAGTLVKNGAGTLTVSGAPYTGTDTDPIPATVTINVNAGTLKATSAGTLGGGAVNVASGATLEMTNGGALGATQAVTNNGNVTLGSTLTAGSITGGILTLSSEFPVDGDLKDVGDITTTGNGFSQGGVLHVYDTEHAKLTGITDIIHGDKHYSLATDVDENGNITVGTADWTTYQLKVDNTDQPTIQEIMDYADAQSGGTGTLQHIVVTGEGMSLVDDSTEFKTSMLGGDKLNSLMLALVNGASLKMDADLATSLQFGSVSGDAAAEIVLEKNAAIDGAILAYTTAGGTADLTVKGAYTLSLSEVDLNHGKLVLQDGAKVAAATIDPEGGDSIVVKDTAELSLANGSISIKAVNAAKDATLSTETGAIYDIGSADYTIENARITLSYSDAAHNFGHVVAGDVALVNAGSASVNDTNAANTAYAALHAQNGNIYLANKAAVTVADLTVDSNRTVGSQLGNNVAITVTDTAEFGSDAKLGAALTMAGGSTLDTANPVALQNHALSLAAGINISDTLWSTLTALEAEHSTNLFTGVSGLTLAGAEFTEDVDLTTIFTHTDLRARKFNLTYKDGNVIVTKELENNRYWKGGDGAWNYSEEKWTDEDGTGTDVKFESGYNAHFTANGGGGIITVGEAVNVASVNVSGVTCNFVNADRLAIANGISVTDSGTATFDRVASELKNVYIAGTASKLTIKNGDVTVNALSNEGTFIVDFGNSLTVKNATAMGGNVTARNLILTGENTFGSVKVSDTVSGATSIKLGGESRITKLSGVNKLTLTDGTLTLGSTVTELKETTLSGALETGDGVGLGSLTMNDGSSITGHGAVSASGITVSGTAEILAGATLQTASVGGTGTLKVNSGNTVSIASGSTTTVSAKLDMQEGSTLANEGTLSVAGRVIAGNGINLGTVNATGTVEVNGASVSAVGGSIATLNIGTGETLAVANDLALTTTTGSAGTLSVTGGLTVNGAAALTDVKAGSLTLEATAGALTVTGTLDTASITLTRVSKTGAYLTAGTLSDTTTAFVVDKQLIWDLNASTGQVITLAYVDSAYAGAADLSINGVKSISDKNRHTYTIMQDATSHDIILKVEDQESGFVWTGNEDTQWSHSGNWSNLVVPGEDDWVQVKGDTHTIELDVDPTVDYFTVSAQSATLQGEHILRVGSALEVNENASLYVGNGAGSTKIEAPTATINGTLVVQPGSTVKADATTITGGTLNVNNATYTAETINMVGGTLRGFPESNVSTGQLYGDPDSIVGGRVAITGTGSRYTGGYDEAYIDIVEDADATLYAHDGLTLGGDGTAKLQYSGSTAIDGIDADALTIILNNPNASIIGSTLTLQEESDLTNGTLAFGMSAIESAKRIDSIQTPQIIEGSLVLGDRTTVDCTTVVVNQDALADSGIAMAVNNHGVYRNLALAYIGNEETYTRNVDLRGDLYGKYYKNARIEAGELLVDMRDDFYRDRTKATTENGIAGAGMLDDALLYKNPQVTSPEGDLAAVMNALETDAIPQRAADKVAAAMSGASHAALGAAWSHDVDRQLRAIRNRTTQMGMADCVVNEDLPYFNAWINAEGDYAKMNADSTLAGYKLSSWGGTLGVDVDLTPRFTFGAAVTAMSGDFTADSAETAKGDLDRMYVTVFGRYSHRAWSHTLVATYGMADTNLKRTVDYGAGSYTAESEADGTAFGVMYEVGYAAAINEDASTCLQPVLNLSYRHSSLDGGREKSRSDAALKLGDAEANVFTVALGARLQGTVGTSVYNRATLFEGRVLCKVDSGDRDVAAGNGFTGIGHSRDVKSAEMGLFGVEVGAGITVPVAERGGALFLDVTGEFRAKYTEINGTVGYRFNF